MKLRLSGVVLSLFLAAGALASMPASIPLKELYSIAKKVGVVEIVEGRVVSAGGESCGARYRGRVVEGMKNTTAGQVVEFGYVPSLKIGSKYLVFLDGYDNVRPDRVTDFQLRCQATLPGEALVGFWRGAMEVSESIAGPTPRDAWVVRPVKHVLYPVGTRSTTVDGERQLVFTDLVSRMTGER